MEDWLLLREYVDKGSDPAFARLVERHMDLVYATCLREVRDPEMAQDVTQAVFLILARKASGIRRGTVLAGWLFNTARFASRNALRQERRRRTRETEAGREFQDYQTPPPDSQWGEIEPYLNDALQALKAGDREAILLRYFEERTLKEVGAALGVSENGAHMRISRALERLRAYFAKRGIILTGAGLAGLLVTEGKVAAAVQPAHVSALARGCLEQGMGRSTEVYGVTEGALHQMKLLLIGKAVLSTCVLLVVGGGLGVAARAFEGATSAPATLSAQELLKGWTETQEKLQSFALVEEAKGRPGRTEFRLDRKTGRFAWRAYVDEAGEKGRHNSQLWDGKEYFSYTGRPGGEPGSLVLDRTGTLVKELGDLRQFKTGVVVAPVFGYFRFDDERLDVTLKRAKSLSVRPKTEAVDGRECHVLEAEAPTGSYTLWLDPGRGYQIARAEVVKRPGHQVSGRALERGMDVRQRLMNVRYRQVDGVWVPVEGEQETSELFPHRSPDPTVWGTQFKLTTFQVNPDLNRPDSFRPDDIPEGSQVILYVPGRKFTPREELDRYVWKEGKAQER